MIKEVLQDIGMNEGEIKFYLLCLEFGAQTATSLGRRLNIPRTTVYGHVDKMLQKGYVYKIKKDTGDLFAATEPRDLIALLERRKYDIDKKIHLMQDHMSDFVALVRKSSHLPRVKYYEGDEALENVYGKIQKSRHLYAYANVESLISHADQYVQGVGQIVKDNNILAKELIYDNKEGKRYQKKRQSQNHQIQLISRSMDFAADNIILDDRVFHIAYGEKVLALELINPVLVNSQKLIFELAWDGAQEMR